MKNSEKLSEAISGIDDKMIEEAYGRQAEKKRVFSVIGKIASVAAIVALAVFAVVLSLYAKKDSNISASSGHESGENLLYEKGFNKFYEHNIGFTSDDGTLEYELKLILPADENFFFKCYAKVINKTDSDIQLHKIADHNSFFYLENILKSAEYEQTFVYDGSAKEDTVTLKPGGSYQELLTYKDGVKAYMKSDYVQNVHDVSGYLTVTVNLDPEMSRTWGKSFTWFEGRYYKNNGKTVEVGEDDYGCFICGDQKVKGLEGFVCDSYYDEASGQYVEADGSGISEELRSMENPPTLHYKTGDKIDFINDPVQTFNGFQLWYISRYNTLDTGDDLYEYLNANPGQYYLTAEQYIGSRYTTMGVKLIVESRTDEIVFMTAAELGAVAKIHVTSLPAGYDYSFEGEGVKPITDYLASLHPISIDDNDGYIDGMTWVIELTYADGTVKEIYHIGNTYIYKSDGNKKYYKLTYEEASRFGSVIGSGENRTEGAEIELVNISQIREINGYSYFESEAEDEWKSAVSGMKFSSVRKIISVAQCMPSLLPKDYLVWNVGMEGSVYSAENAHSISFTFIDGIDTDQDGNLINNGTYSSLSIFLYKKDAYEGSEYISKLADKYQIKGVLSADSIYEKYSGDEITCTFMIETDTYYVLYEYRGYEGGKRNLSSKNLYEIAASAPYIKENGYTPTEITVTEPVTETDKYAGLFPDDFSFTIVWGTYGISSYDSKTGVLIKSKDATDVSRYTTTYKASNEVLFKIYELLFDKIKINSYPDEYDPFNSPDAETRISSSPNQTIIISVTAYGEEKTVRCENICFGSKGYDERATQFLEAEFAIVDFLTRTDEWQALPEYEVFFD